MKLALFPLIIALLAPSVFAGNFFGPNPWANGAYYPGQLDGKYSATVFGNNTSGVLGFALKDGSPTIVTNTQSTVSTNISVVQSTIIPDPWQNYYMIFFNGITFFGPTFATINVSSKQVSGAMYGGQGVISATNLAFASGGFTATLTSDKSPITFVGNNTGQLQVVGGAGTTFSLNGIKISDTTGSSSGTTPQ